MQTENKLEELTKEYNLACAQAVRDAIHEVVSKWDPDLVTNLNEQGYDITAELDDGDLCILAYIGKDDYFGPIKYENDSLNEAIQEAFDNLGFQVVFNAMLHYGMETVVQIMTWGIY